MPKPKRGPRLGGSPAHQRLILSNLATQLFEHGRITTTEPKARALRPVAEKLITKAKKAHAGQNALHQRREVLKTIRDKSVVHALFTEIAPTFEERPGGYTRITKLGPRKGDNAPMAMIELVTEAYEPKPAAPAKKAAAPKAAPAAPAETATDEPPTELVEEASPETSVVAEEEPAGEPAGQPNEESEVDPADAADTADVEAAPTTDDPAAAAAEEDAPAPQTTEDDADKA